jgi:CMP-N,N'-diacetyllegionaminic acid synthase
MLNIVGLILARGGSKRIIRKNTKELGGKPLIAWSIQSAILSQSLSRVLISTDDDDIANISLEYGAEVPWLRPSELSADHSLSIDAILHVINWLTDEKIPVDGIMLLQPTSPFRKVSTIKACIELFKGNSLRPVVSFDRVPYIPEWCFRKSGNRLSPVLNWNSINNRSQDIQPVLQLNGLVYLATPQYLVQNRGFVGPSTIPFVSSSPDESIDIDTYDDWIMAERIAKGCKQTFWHAL